MELPTIYKLAKEVAEKALDEITYEGKTIREWVEIIVKQQPCEACREQVLKHLEKEDWADTVKCVMNMPFINKPCVSDEVCREDKIQVLDNIRAEIETKIVRRPWLDFKDRERARNDAFLEVLDIIDKYKRESEEEE